MEPLLWRIVVRLLAAGLLPDGDVLDAGANDGRTTARLATLVSPRRVVAVEPIHVNYDHIRAAVVAAHPNVQAVHGGLGATPGNGSYAHRQDRKVGTMIGKLSLYARSSHGTSTYPILTVDELFSTRRLALAHWDVEGAEADVLDGAARTLRRDRPIFTIETHAAHAKDAHDRALARVRALGYESMEVPERCGGWADCRNHVCAPAGNASRIVRSLVADLTRPKHGR